MPDATLASQLEQLIETLAARRDIEVVKKIWGEPARAEQVQALRGRLPDDLLEFYSEVGEVAFVWRFRERPLKED